MWDARGYWEKAALDYTTCDGGAGTPTPFDDISQNDAAARYLDNSGLEAAPRFLDGRRCLFLLRRLWQCADANGGGWSTCDHSETQAQLLVAALVASDLEAFFTAESPYKISNNSPVSFRCGVNPTNDGLCKFDLNTQEQVSYFLLT